MPTGLQRAITPDTTTPGQTAAGADAAHIGVFDSGIGGLSVLAALHRQWPGAHLDFIADSAYTPWGDRSADWVTARSLQLAGQLIDDGAQLVLVACNTGTTQAISALRARWPAVPFVGVEPGVKPAVAASRNGRVAVMATTGTLRSARLQRLVDEHAGQASVLRLPCPGLVEAIELSAGGDDHALRQQLDNVVASLHDAQVDTVVLGCTHYPLVADALRQRLGAGVQLLDTADAVVRRVRALLGGHRAATADALGRLRLQATGSTTALTQAARRWLVPDAQATPLDLPPPSPTR